MMSSLFLSICLVLAVPAESNAEDLNPALRSYVQARVAEFDRIPAERKRELEKIALYVRGRVEAKQPARVSFICGQNTRRSHLSQVWAQTAATWYGVPGVEAFSGGTEVSAFNPRGVEALRRAGFRIAQPAASENPHYLVRVRDDAPAVDCFSKVYNQAPNPTTDFCAVLVCTQADKNCPVVKGAAVRLCIPFEDPKPFDGTREEAARYDERCQQIAREMLYAFSKVRP